MVCKSGAVCKNCAECFGCHVMKSANVVGNCRPKKSRICPKEKAQREAEEQTQKSNEVKSSLSSLQDIHLHQSKPSISKTICGDNTFYVAKGLSVDPSGGQVQFSQYPGLAFSSMESAFYYFEMRAKLQKQGVIQANGQLIDHAVQRARPLRALDSCDEVWRFDASLKPANLKPMVRLPRPYSRLRSLQLHAAAEPVSQARLKAPEPVYPSSPSSLLEVPPQTLFAESTPHARDIQAQPRVRLPADGLNPWRVDIQATNGSTLQQNPPFSPTTNQANALIEKQLAPYTYHDTISTSSSDDDEILAQPQSSHGSCPIPSAYSATALPQTLAKKDLRVLGVPLTAGIDEIRAGFWLRVLQYNADRYQATSLEDRAVAALKLIRAQEAADRLCGGIESN